MYQGQFLAAALKAKWVMAGEIMAELRAQGLASVAEAAAVILETSGNLSVLQRTTTAAQSVLQEVPLVVAPTP
ncbi:MAG: YetF domain-containing protein [Janthinobacterium lividum]